MNASDNSLDDFDSGNKREKFLLEVQLPDHENLLELTEELEGRGLMVREL
jgi:hypothetical protein